MPLGTEIDLSPGQIILEGDWRPSPLSSERVAEQAAPPSVRPMSIVAKRSPISATAEHLLALTYIYIML